MTEERNFIERMVDKRTEASDVLTKAIDLNERAKTLADADAVGNSEKAIGLAEVAIELFEEAARHDEESDLARVNENNATKSLEEASELISTEQAFSEKGD